MLLRLIIAGYILLYPAILFSQVNLVPNPSFEIISSCPNGPDSIMNAPPWFQPFKFPNGKWNSSSELLSTCSSNNNSRVPNNFSGFQYPRTDSSYSGIYFYYSQSYREYIEVMLLDSLRLNKQYCVKFYVSLSDNSKYATKNLSAYFSKDSCLYVPPPYILPNPPQVTNTDSIIVKDKTNWQKIELLYTSQGAKERFVTIGNMENDANTYTVTAGAGTIQGAYYYIDDVSVIDISTPAFAGKDTTINLGDSVFIGRPSEIGLDEDCIWFVNSSAIDTIAGMWVHPTVTTTYILQQTICGTTNHDTVIVTVNPDGIEYLNETNQISIYPNPTTGDFWIKIVDNPVEDFSVVISDLLGKRVLEKNVSIQESIKITTNLQEGTYFISIKTNDNNFKPYNGKIAIIK